VDLDSDSKAAHGLRRYVRLVAEAIGIGAEASTIQFDHPVSVYLALDRCFTEPTEHDLALLWHERHGWSLAAEVNGETDLHVLGYLAFGVLPSPRAVAGYVDRACRGEGAGTAAPPSAAFDVADLAGRLADYAEQIRDTPSRVRTAVPRARGRLLTAAPRVTGRAATPEQAPEALSR
jgi:hypothetical protein